MLMHVYRDFSFLGILHGPISCVFGAYVRTYAAAKEPVLDLSDGYVCAQVKFCLFGPSNN